MYFSVVEHFFKCFKYRQYLAGVTLSEIIFMRGLWEIHREIANVGEGRKILKCFYPHVYLDLLKNSINLAIKFGFDDTALLTVIFEVINNSS